MSVQALQLYQRCPQAINRYSYVTLAKRSPGRQIQDSRLQVGLHMCRATDCALSLLTNYNALSLSYMCQMQLQMHGYRTIGLKLRKLRHSNLSG